MERMRPCRWRSARRALPCWTRGRQLSHVEEALIDAAIARGETVYRSPTALPQAVLGLRIAERSSRAHEP